MLKNNFFGQKVEYLLIFITDLDILSFVFIQNIFSLRFSNFTFVHINKTIKNMDFPEMLVLIKILKKFVKNIFSFLKSKCQEVSNHKSTLVHPKMS